MINLETETIFIRGEAILLFTCEMTMFNIITKSYNVGFSFTYFGY